MEQKHIFGFLREHSKKNSYKSSFSSKEYTLFNTHISYKFYFDQELQIDLPALNSIIESPAACTTCGYRYDRNPNSVYCCSETDLNDFLNDIFDKNISEIKPEYIEIDVDKAVYSKTKDAIYKDDNIQFPFIFEVLQFL
jgi:glutaredoxin